jgi:3-hydroxybutyryl-CoA dehydrogenase
MSAEQRDAAKNYVEQNTAHVRRSLDLHPERLGRVEAANDLPSAVAGAWMVVESVPERIDVKTEVFGELNRVARGARPRISRPPNTQPRGFVGSKCLPRRRP